MRVRLICVMAERRTPPCSHSRSRRDERDAIVSGRLLNRLATCAASAGGHCALTTSMMETVIYLIQMRDRFNWSGLLFLRCGRGSVASFRLQQYGRDLFRSSNVVINIIDFIRPAPSVRHVRSASSYMVSVPTPGSLARAMLVPVAQSDADGELKQDLGFLIFILWFAAIVALLGDDLSRDLVIVLARPAPADPAAPG